MHDELHHPADSEFRKRLRSASSHELSVRRTRLVTYGDRAFPVAAVRVWNSLPQHGGGVFLLRQSGLTDLARCVCRSFIRPSVSFLVF